VQDGIVLVGGVGEGGNALSDVYHFDPHDRDNLRSETPLPVPAAEPHVVTLGNALYLLADGELFVRDPNQQWTRLAPPQDTLPRDAALVASDPYIIILGGEGEAGLEASVWQYQALFRTFIPLAPAGE
ncbi:MAG: hypothetical protein ACRDIB_10985, partial [Ardenticatenaceae bacterium]